MEQSLINAGQENFSLPHDVVQLPTGGIFYKHKKKSLKVGYLTANDENILMNAVSSSKDSIVLSLLKNKIYEYDVKPEDLIDSDVEALLIFLRNSSFGPEYNLILKDPSTGKDFTSTILLDELNINKGQTNPNEDGTFTTVLPKTGVTVKLRPLTFGEKLEIEKMVESYPLGRVAPRVTWTLNKNILEIDGNPDRQQISLFIESLPIMDSKHIRKFIKENVPSLDLSRQVLAPSGEVVSVDINFGVEFFRVFF
jgi:hypothetical protein